MLDHNTQILQYLYAVVGFFFASINQECVKNRIGISFDNQRTYLEALVRYLPPTGSD